MMLEFFYKAAVYYTRAVYPKQARVGKICLGLIDRNATPAVMAEARKWAEDLCPYDSGWKVRIEGCSPGLKYDGTDRPDKMPIFAAVKNDCVLYYDLSMTSEEKATQLLLSTADENISVNSEALFNVLSIEELTHELSTVLIRLMDEGTLIVEGDTIRRPLETPDGAMPELHEAAPGEGQQPD